MLEPEKPGNDTQQPPNPAPLKDDKPGLGQSEMPGEDNPKDIPAKE